MLQLFSSERKHSCETAGDKPEEGVGDGRSVYMVGLYKVEEMKQIISHLITLNGTF